METAYTALIRTRDSFPLVADTVASLRAQNVPPARIVAVDSGSHPDQRSQLAALVDTVVDYPVGEFNYSKAINLGIACCETPTTLIVSSHVVLTDPTLVERAFAVANDRGVFAFYLWSTSSPWCVEIVDRTSFNGRNGLFNYCAFVPTDAVRRRPFREEVFSAEDQEWAAFHMRTAGATFARIGTDRIENRNPNTNALKFINEEVAIAYYVCREKLGVRYLVSWLLRSALAFVRGHSMRSKAHLAIFKALIDARKRPPVRTSRYY